MIKFKNRLSGFVLLVGAVLVSGPASAWEMECTVDPMDDEETCKIIAVSGPHRLQILDAGGTGLGVSMGVSNKRVEGSEFMVRIDGNKAIDVAEESLIMLPEGQDVIAILPSQSGQKIVEQMKAGIEIKGTVRTSQGRELAEFSLMGFTDKWNQYASRVDKKWD